MLEYDIIQTRGFHNIEEDGEVIGFQLCFRLKNYRGIWLSMLRPEDLIVDGEVFKKEDIRYVISGLEYTYDELLATGDTQMPSSKPGTVIVKKPGGLSQGYHDVQFALRVIACYIPPFINGDEAFAKTPPKYEQKRMLIV